MKKIIIIVGIILLITLTLMVLRDQIIRTTITVAASSILGAPVRVEGFSMGIFKQSMMISGLTVYNPKGFPKGIIIELTKIRVEYDLAALLKKEIHLPNAEIVVKEVGLIKNREGKLNADALKVSQNHAPKEPKAKSKPADLPLRIDHLKLNIGRLVMKDYSVGDEPTVNVYEININKDYKNITSAKQLAILILSEPMKSAGIKGAAIYGVAMVAGVAVLPVAVAATFVGKDSAQAELDVSYDELCKATEHVLNSAGRLTRMNERNGCIGGDVRGASIGVKLEKISERKTRITVSARKFMLPRPEIASGIIYKIKEELIKK
ncbi:MAG: hypothetical protein C4533_04880 [Candidatus Omnitrophota bacterium]|jgi:hypothetical protein|nr:MAG: hypothetical protein C4533_04880 [Candidatus Omnitrophota bacterium]